MRLRVIVLGIFFIFSASASYAAEQPLKVLIVSSPLCPACQKAEKEVLPLLKEKYGDEIEIKKLDYGEPGDYARLLGLQDKYNWHPEKILIPILLIDGNFLVGLDSIRSYAQLYIDTALSLRNNPARVKERVALDYRFPFLLIALILLLVLCKIRSGRSRRISQQEKAGKGECAGNTNLVDSSEDI